MGELSNIELLPVPFLDRMKEMLGSEYDAFLESYRSELMDFVSIHQK